MFPFQFQHCFNPSIECITILNRHFSQSTSSPIDLRDHINRYCEQHNIPPCALEAYTDVLIKIEDHVLAGLLPLDPQAEFLFACPDGFFPSLSWALYFLEEEGIDFSKLSEQELLLELRYLMHFTFNCSPEKLESVVDAATLADFLHTQPCSPITKWACSTFWWNPVTHQHTFRTILHKAVELFMEILPLVQDALAQYIPGLERAFSDESHKSILDNLSLEKASCIVVYPYCMQFEGFGVIWNRHRNRRGEVLILMGILRPTLASLIAQYGDKFTAIVNGARALGDQRRVEIITALKKKPLCNREIAQLLDLSAATVSHHMNCLVREGFVTVSKRGNWMDYSLDEGKLRYFLECIQSAWL